MQKHEGLRLQMYQDSIGKWTIGYGRNLTDRGLSHDEAAYLLENDLSGAIKDVLTHLPWVEALTEPRQAVVVEMAFNMGMPKLLGFKNTLKAMQLGNYDLAAVGMLSSRWAEQVGRRALTLADQMRSGQWQLDIG